MRYDTKRKGYGCAAVLGVLANNYGWLHREDPYLMAIGIIGIIAAYSFITLLAFGRRRCDETY